ncbi:MAG: tetratricopeptide repeat protein [Acidobacteriota bacterium]
MPSETPAPTVLGVYSRRQMAAIGSGVTMVDHRNVTYWYVRQLDESRVEVQPLTAEGLPSGIVENVPVKRFLTEYTPEPLYYVERSVPVVKTLASKLLGAGESASLSMLDSSELNALKALLCEPLVQPDYSHPGYEEAHQVMMQGIQGLLATLTCNGAQARREHCVRFSRFGVTLRKDGHLDESIEFYNKALAIEQDDENLYFNMARVYYDKGDLQECGRVLEKALSLNPAFTEAGRFVRFLSRRQSGLI